MDAGVVELAKRGIAVKAGPTAIGSRRASPAIATTFGGRRRAKAARRRLQRASGWRALRRTLRPCGFRVSGGELLDAKVVEAEWFDILRIVRSGVLAAPSRVGSKLPHLSGSELVAIDTELRGDEPLQVRPLRVLGEGQEPGLRAALRRLGRLARGPGASGR